MKALHNEYQDIDAIIFDLGGVLLNIDYDRTSDAFKQLGVHNFNILYSQSSQYPLFDDLEIGKITPKEWRQSLRGLTNLTLEDNRIDEAWNAMLLDFPLNRLNLLERLSKHYRIFLFSNTNEVHANAYLKYLKNEMGITNFYGLFEHAYLSFNCGFRKPHPSSFSYILNKHQLIPDKTLFIDDSIQHIEGAKQAGLLVHHLKKGVDVISLFKE